MVEDTTSLDVVFDRTGTLLRDGAFARMETAILVGDNASNTALAGFVSINLNSLAATANVTRVVLNLKATIFSGNPFGDFGTITVDHVNVVGGIIASDYNGGTIRANVATIPSFPMTTPQDIAIDVTSEVNADRAAGRPISSFRLRFDAAPTADAFTDAVSIEASQDNPAQRPSATVTIRR